MSTRLMVDDQHRLQEVREGNIPQQPPALRAAARVISYIFHPVFVPIYIILYMLYVHPYLFIGFDGWPKTAVLIQSIVNLTFFPVVTVLLLKALKFIQTIYLKTQKDRVIPYIACGIWYFWIWYVWRNQPEYPPESVSLTFSIFLASAMGLMANIYMKVSMHAISMGLMLVFFLQLAFRHDVGMGFYLSLAFLVAGLVCTARFIVSDHSQKEIYTGLALGALAMVIGNWIMI